jgi:tellurite resistance protein TerC
MLLHEFIEIPEWASLVLLPFLFGRILFPTMNKLKNEKETQ